MDLTWNTNAPGRAAAITRAASLGTRISRNSLLWHRVEPVRGTRDWSLTDAVVAELEAAGIEPLLVAYGSPPWANGVASSTPGHYNYVPTDETAYGIWLDEFVDFLAEAAARYGGRVRWEVWNEQNQPHFWKPSPNAARYAQMYTRARDAIRAADPQAEVAVGGLVGLTFGPPQAIAGVDFVTQLLAAGVRPDAVAVHPYSSHDLGPDVFVQWNNNFTDIALVHERLVAAGHEDVPIWVTEWGWWTDGTAPSRERQARYVAESLAMIRDRYPYVTVATYFVDYDRPAYSAGLYDLTLSPKPAAHAFADFMTNLTP